MWTNFKKSMQKYSLNVHSIDCICMYVCFTEYLVYARHDVRHFVYIFYERKLRLYHIRC